MATGAVGYDLRAQPRCQAVIAREIRGSTPALNAELLRQPYTFVAAGTGELSNVLGGDGRAWVPVRCDGMNSVTISAHRRLPVCLCNRLAVNALLKLFRDLVVALAASQRHVELED